MKKYNFLLALFFIFFFHSQNLKSDEAKMIKGLEILLLSILIIDLVFPSFISITNNLPLSAVKYILSLATINPTGLTLALFFFLIKLNTSVILIIFPALLSIITK